MNNYTHILNSLRFNRISENEWRLDEVLDNDIINYATVEGHLHYYVYAPDEPPAAKFIIVKIDTIRERLSIHFNHGKSGNCTREVPLSFFEGIFVQLLEDKRDSQLTKIIN